MDIFAKIYCFFLEIHTAQNIQLAKHGLKSHFSTHLHMVPLALGGINVCECVKHGAGVKDVSIACRF